MAIPDLLAQWLVNGVALGSVYALVALGFVTIYNVSGILNLAQGEFLMLGALLTVSLSRAVPLPLAGLLAVLLTAASGAGVYILTLLPARHASATTLIIISIGVSAVLRGTALLVWGVDAYALPPFSAEPPLRLGSLVLTRQAVWVVGITLLAVLLLCAVVQSHNGRTRAARMRAQSRRGATHGGAAGAHGAADVRTRRRTGRTRRHRDYAAAIRRLRHGNNARPQRLCRGGYRRAHQSAGSDRRRAAARRSGGRRRRDQLSVQRRGRLCDPACRAVVAPWDGRARRWKRACP